MSLLLDEIVVPIPLTLGDHTHFLTKKVKINPASILLNNKKTYPICKNCSYGYLPELGCPICK